MGSVSLVANSWNKCEFCHQGIFDGIENGDYPGYTAVKSKRDKNVRFYHDKCIKKQFHLKEIKHRDTGSEELKKKFEFFK